jgi:hypothetical protein
MRTTVVGQCVDFAAASRAAAELMLAGFAQSQISIVGRDDARFTFAGAVTRDLVGATHDDFENRLVCALSRLCVPPPASLRHAVSLADGGGLVAVQAEADAARRAEAVMNRHGTSASYAAGAVPFVRPARERNEPRLSIA